MPWSGILLRMHPGWQRCQRRGLALLPRVPLGCPLGGSSRPPPSRRHRPILLLRELSWTPTRGSSQSGQLGHKMWAQLLLRHAQPFRSRSHRPTHNHSSLAAAVHRPLSPWQTKRLGSMRALTVLSHIQSATQTSASHAMWSCCQLRPVCPLSLSPVMPRS